MTGGPGGSTLILQIRRLTGQRIRISLRRCAESSQRPFQASLCQGIRPISSRHTVKCLVARIKPLTL